MDALREESSDLLGRSKQSTLRALAGKLKEVEAQLKELRLTVKGYDEQRAACTSAEVELDMLRGTLARVLKEQSRQQRIMRVHPSLVELVAVEAELANLTDLQTLSPRFAEELADARRNVEEGKKHRAEAQKQYDHIEAELSDLRCNDALLAEERRVRDVTELAGQVSKGRAQRRSEERTVVDRRAELSGLRTLTGLSPDADLGALMPSPLSLARVDELSAAGKDLLLQRKIQTERADELGREVEDTRQSTEARSTSGVSAPLRVEVGALAGLPKAASAAKALSDRWLQTELELKDRVDRLGFATVDQLRGFECPDELIVQAELESRAKERSLIEQQRADGEKQTARHRTALGQLSRLQAAGPVPTESNIEHARRDRESAWAPIRAVYLGQPAVTPPHERARACRDRGDTRATRD